jgi:hypothetical protein
LAGRETGTTGIQAAQRLHSITNGVSPTRPGRRTGWHSVAASALHRIRFKKQRSRARSGRLHPTITVARDSPPDDMPPSNRVSCAKAACHHHGRVGRDSRSGCSLRLADELVNSFCIGNQIKCGCHALIHTWPCNAAIPTRERHACSKCDRTTPV